MRVSDFDFELPPELIAQEAAPRGTSRLLVLDRGSGATRHARIGDLPGLLAPGDLLVVNDTRVFPARLLGRRAPSGGAVECMLVERIGGTGSSEEWDALMHPGQKLKPGARLVFQGPAGTLHGEVLERRFFGRRRIRLWAVDGPEVGALIDALGHVPLPPYIHRPDRADDRERYQTIYARRRGSVAAPTAGLHFTGDILRALDARGVGRVSITLHVGYGTFQPVRAADVEQHVVEAERYEIEDAAAAQINRALDDGRRIVAVGTTTTRALESAAIAGSGRLGPGRGEASLFIYPGYTFRVVQALLTNFHLPKSSLLMLVSAFAGREPVLAAYREAVAERYRFYSYGDAMLVI
ncbi:MAG: tRNA preQ1(34) S-adenosylmethionine ribosyltransferase-isomerase QueA [Acidobacteria bacterium]|nr:tRNA preQ1(34) S-adenosylmethionine ribosyltransferase-isomerase QueA [Acidobacteriota bacterium]